MLTQENIDALIEIVRMAARTEIMPRFRAMSDGDVHQKSSADDLVTQADISAERRITQDVSRLLPEASFVGEEAAPSVAAINAALSSDLCVVIDPVDGTWNFAHGLAVFGTILAVVERGDVVFGLLYDPVMDDWVMAQRGGGSFYCRPGKAPRRLWLSQADAQSRMRGYVPLFMFPRDQRIGLGRVLPELGRVTSLGCSCHEYRQMLFGAADFSLNAKLNVWDHAAGVLAIEEAGGQAQLLGGDAYDVFKKEGYLLLTRQTRIMADMTGRLALQGVGP